MQNFSGAARLGILEPADCLAAEKTSRRICSLFVAVAALTFVEFRLKFQIAGRNFTEVEFKVRSQ